MMPNTRQWTLPPWVEELARGVLLFEPLLLLLIVYGFWFPSPLRDHWVWLLWLLVPFMAARWLAYGRLWSRTPLDGWLLAFLALGIVNIWVANLDLVNPPFTFFPPGEQLIVLARPLLGIALYLYFVEYARVHGSMTGLVVASVVLALVMGAMALLLTQWTSKSDLLSFVTNRLPVIDNASLEHLPGALAAWLRDSASLGINPNEIAGGLAWIGPLMGGLAMYSWKNRALRIGLAVVFVGVFAALFLGQSRFALAGVLAVLVVQALLLIPTKRDKVLVLAGLGVVILFEIGMVFNLLPQPGGSPAAPSASLSERDENSMSTRFEIWGSALHIIRDFPVFGVGMNSFRIGEVRALYPVPDYTKPVLPHAHDEWLQVGTDLGVPGLVVFVAWQVVIAIMLLNVWRHGDPAARAVAAAVAGGLLAHAVFGLGDAITLWDRLAFVFWWLMALGGAQYWLVRHPPNQTL